MRWVFFLTIIMTSMNFYSNQSIDYNQAWKEISTLIEERKFQSALDLTRKVYQSAITEKSDPHIIKSIYYTSMLMNRLSESESIESIDYLMKEVKNWESPIANMVHLMIAESLRSYYSEVRYKIRDRTYVGSTDDMKQWAPINFEVAILYYSDKALDHFEALNISIEEYKDVLKEYNEEGLRLRPTLADYISHRLIQQMEDPLMGISDFSPAFSDSILLADRDVFSGFEWEDEMQGTKWKTLKIFQKLIHLHKGTQNTHTVLYVDLIRLDYVFRESVLKDKKRYYLATLDSYIQENLDTLTYNMILFHKARFLNDQSGQDEKESIEMKKLALETCKLAKGNDVYAQRCIALNRMIQSPEFYISSKEVFTTKDEHRVIITSRNINSVYYRVVPISQEQWVGDRWERSDAYVNQLLTQSTLQSGEINLDIKEPLAQEKNQFTFESLPLGRYGILMSLDETFSQRDSGLYFHTFQVSNISAVNISEPGLFDLLVTDRISGKPVKNANVDFYNIKYDLSTGKYHKEWIETQKSNKEGIVKGSIEAKNRSVHYRIRNNKDTLDVGSSHYFYSTYRDRTHTYEEFFILTDRAIYRPGQTVYFKALHILRDNKSLPGILKNQSITVELVDASQRVISSKKITTNSFGSVSSSFTLPVGGLTGYYQLNFRSEKGSGSYSFRAEEYKRPTFIVEIDESDESHTLDSLVTVSGKAVTYNNVPVANAEVKYVVTRKRPFIFRRMWMIYPPYSSEEKIVSEGMTKTDVNGKFLFSYEALSDQGNFWQFEASIDVIENTGETRSALQSMTITDKPVIILSNSKTEWDTAEKPILEYNLTNASGTEVKAASSYTVILLSRPENNLENDLEIDRPWYHGNGNPDRDQWLKWNESRVVKRGDIGYDQEKKINLDELKPGVYKWIVTSMGERYEDVFLITDFNRGRFPEARDVYVSGIDEKYQPGEKVDLQLGSYHKKIYLYMEVFKGGVIIKKEWVDLKKKSTYSIPVTAEDFGGFSVRITANIDNRFYNKVINIHVPWNHKDLIVKYNTFRSTLEPGQEEEWEIEIEGSKSGKTEVAAVLYDMSLDVFAPHTWSRAFYPLASQAGNNHGIGYSRITGRHIWYDWNQYDGRITSPAVSYPEFDFQYYDYVYGLYESPMMKRSMAPDMMHQEMTADESEMSPPNTAEPPESPEIDQVPIRKNLQETVFFFPDMKTDDDGNVTLNFTMGEALTGWKFLLFAHNEELQYAFDSREVITHKELMVQPFVPRFMRQGDEVTITARISNQSAAALPVHSTLKIKNARTGEDLTQTLLKNGSVNVDTLASGESNTSSWDIRVPTDLLDPVLYSVVAVSERHTDGEEGLIPILSNWTWVTETKAFSIKGGTSVDLDIEDFFKKGKNPNLTLEYTPHPVWTAIQSVPVLEENGHESSDRLAGLYALSVFYQKLLSDHPSIEEVIRQWKAGGEAALQSSLFRNDELKSVLIENTPWLVDAMEESERMKDIVRLLDKNMLNYNRVKHLRKLFEMQNADGGLPWFKGGNSNWFITHKVLDYMLRWPYSEEGALNQEKIDFIHRLLHYADQQSLERYQKILLREKENQTGKTRNDVNHVTARDLYYLFIRSSIDHPMDEKTREAKNFFTEQAYKHWTSMSDYEISIIARLAHRDEKQELASSIVQSFEERLLHNKEGSVYFKLASGWLWYQRPLSSHISILDMFTEIKSDSPLIHGMKLWLLQHKRTHMWPNNETTTSAIWSLLEDKGASENEWLKDKSDPLIYVNGILETTEITPTAGTGLVKKHWDSHDAQSVNNIRIDNPNDNISWGGIYQSYMADLSEIEASGDDMMKVDKKLFKLVLESNQEKLIPVEKENIQPGDKIVSRIVIILDRDMEFLHLKDMRSAGLEPVELRSGYHWQGGLGYYQTTGDVATHFYMDRVTRGTYVFEHMLRASHKGNFENGITTLQCLYAPEFSAHSAGYNLKIGM